MLFCYGNGPDSSVQRTLGRRNICSSARTAGISVMGPKGHNSKEIRVKMRNTS